MKKLKYVSTYVFLVFVFAFAALFLLLPKSEYSQNEKRNLSEFPDFSIESLSDGSYFKGIETYVSDQFPFRDYFVGINSYYSVITGKKDVNGVYKCSNGYLIAVPSKLNENRCQQNVKRLAGFADTQDLKSSLMIVPTPGYILEDWLPAVHESYSDDRIFEIAEASCGNTSLIDLRPIFNNNKNDMQIYYKTDHHVTSEGSYLMYQTFCRSRGIIPTSNFSVKETLADFYGTNYSKSGLWLEKSDDVEIWHSSSGNLYEVVIDDISSKTVYNSLYFYEHNNNMDKYPVFLNGNHALVTIKNESCQNGRRLLVLKDSYAHCFSTFLCENYEKICLVDLRYYRGAVSELIKQNEINELLYLYGAENLAGLADIAWLK